MQPLPILIFLAALALSALGTLATMKLGERWGLVQTPGGRRQHTRPVSRIGGVGLLLGFLLVSAWLYWAGPRPLDTNLHLPLLGVWLGTALAMLGGLADDKFEFKSGPQFAIQFAAVLIALLTDVFIEEVTLPIVGRFKFPFWLVVPITTLWVMGMMNTVNWLDGLDGLAGGVGAIAALLFALHSYQLQQPEVALYSLALAGACVGFVIFNFFPARVFLGSAGALGLGFALSALSIIAPARVATALLVMAIPIADVAFQIIDRWRRGQSPMQGDRGHLHFRLADMGFSQRQIVISYWLFCGLFGAAALLLPSPALKLIAIVVLGALVIGVLVALSRRQNKV
ncbi:MAG: undecaprenyl/decaprenyl-phosphate alpha-N-acetylglucosaminyl 1-phosphate transferase [Anaerolineales bacterium]|nr:undecaprenyl/decaprenyl-phosphate alpha-N-acetylglucosaminyl 1-phosphate transferase [Anaerolineales bacterium]